MAQRLYNSGVLVIESLSYDGSPPLRNLQLELPPGALPAVVGPNANERTALVELLAGYRSESEGQVVLDGKALSPRARRAAVVVLPQQPALTENLSIAEHLRLLARLRGARADAAVLQNVLTFTGVTDPALRPGELTGESQLRLTLALSVVGRPALVVALDPPPEVAALMLQLKSPDRALLLVTGSLQGVEDHVTRVYGLHDGALTFGLGTPASPTGRAFLLHVIRGSTALENEIGRHTGTSLERISEGLYRLHVAPALALAPLVRALVRARVLLESIEPV